MTPADGDRSPGARRSRATHAKKPERSSHRCVAKEPSPARPIGRAKVPTLHHWTSALVSLSAQPALGLERGHAARAGGCDGLAIGPVRDVPRREDARDARLRGARLDLHIAVVVDLE